MSKQNAALLLVMMTGLWGSSSGIAGEVNPARIQVAKFESQSPLQPKRLEPLLHFTEKYDYYDIDGTTTVDLRRQMRQNGTKWNDGKVYAALTTWNVDYHYDVTSENGRYSLASISTSLDIVYHFPRRLASKGAQEQLAGQWNAYMDHLKVHEYGHKDLAVKTAAEINTVLASLRSFSSRSELEREVRVLVQAKLKQLKEVQIDYDAETRHGEKQGALLP